MLTFFPFLKLPFQLQAISASSIVCKANKHTRRFCPKVRICTCNVVYPFIQVPSTVHFHASKHIFKLTSSRLLIQLGLQCYVAWKEDVKRMVLSTFFLKKVNFDHRPFFVVCCSKGSCFRFCWWLRICPLALSSHFRYNNSNVFARLLDPFASTPCLYFLFT
jgi:hypothetical protein